MITDNLLPEGVRKQVYDFLYQPGWLFGWHSRRGKDPYAFWHKHFAGAIFSDHVQKDRQDPYDCAEELKVKAPLLFQFWHWLVSRGVLNGHRIVRCYANAYPFGSEGSLHTDSVAPNSFTSIYYPHSFWSPNWGGETVFFNKDESDIIGCVYPKGNRLLTFRGIVPHVARGVSRTCPALRVTLMFKTELLNGGKPLSQLPDKPVQGTGNTPLWSELLGAPKGDT